MRFATRVSTIFSSSPLVGRISNVKNFNSDTCWLLLRKPEPLGEGAAVGIFPVVSELGRDVYINLPA